MINHPNGEVFYLCELRGLSTDTKPTSIQNGTIENGSEFKEIDTGDVYLYDLENKEWDNITTPEETPASNEK